ncbi:MAG TPA: DUF1844 domain-containing protein [Acidisarcina sp.]|nr:DUF1844 domain-containing protein [Acidisarcina sp.]
MDEKESQFTVTDRRKFTLEGELRDEASLPPEEPVAESKPAPSPAAAEKPARGPQLVTSAPTEPAAEHEEDGSEVGPPPTAQETAEQHAAYQQSSRVLDKMIQDANPGMPASEEATFEQLVQSIYLSAIVQMGGATKPGEQPRVDIVGARQNIDILGILVDKTKGNLTDRESHLLQNALFDLRMMFLELTNAIAAQATQPPTGKK